MLDTSKIYKSDKYGDIKVLKYVSSAVVHIEFMTSGNITTSSAANIRLGTVRDKLYPITYGVGFFGIGVHKGHERGVKTKAYGTWHHMLERCYDLKYHKKYPTYIGVTTCKEWHNFQTFAAWFRINYKEGLHLDKDSKQRGVKNKIYSPDTCVFLTKYENAAESAAGAYSVVSPEGIVYEGVNLSKFCRNKGLTNSGMSLVNSGSKSQYKKWTRAQ